MGADSASGAAPMGAAPMGADSMGADSMGADSMGADSMGADSASGAAPMGADSMGAASAPGAGSAASAAGAGDSASAAGGFSGAPASAWGAGAAASASTGGSGSGNGSSAGGGSVIGASVTGGSSTGGSSTSGGGSLRRYSTIKPGSVPSTNWGVSDLPQPRDRSPPKPLSASNRKAAFTGSCHWSRAASSRKPTTVHRPHPSRNSMQAVACRSLQPLKRSTAAFQRTLVRNGPALPAETAVGQQPEGGFHRL